MSLASALFLLSACVHEHLMSLKFSNVFILMPICTVHLLHSLYIQHLTVKSGEWGLIVFSTRGPITLSVRPWSLLSKSDIIGIA